MKSKLASCRTILLTFCATSLFTCAAETDALMLAATVDPIIE